MAYPLHQKMRAPKLGCRHEIPGCDREQNERRVANGRDIGGGPGCEDCAEREAYDNVTAPAEASFSKRLLAVQIRAEVLQAVDKRNNHFIALPRLRRGDLSKLERVDRSGLVSD